MIDDFQWVMETPELQAKYAGQLIVVHKKQVVAAGRDEAALMDATSSNRRPREELMVEMLAPGFEVPPDVFLDADAQ